MEKIPKCKGVNWKQNVLSQTCVLQLGGENFEEVNYSKDITQRARS